MKTKILILTLLLSSFSLLTPAQTDNDNNQWDKELLDAINVFSKFNGLILIQDSVIKNEKGKILKIYYILVSSPEGNGYRNSIQSVAVFNINAQIYFRDYLFEKENYFKMNGTWNSKGNLGLRSFSYIDWFGINYNDQIKITKLKGGFLKTGKDKYEQKNVDVIYDPTGNNLHFKESIVFAKGKDSRHLKEIRTLPSGYREYKEFKKDGMKNFEIHKVLLSTYKGKEGKIINESHYVYSFSKKNEFSTILKLKNDANDSMESKTIYHYENNVIIGSSSYDKLNNQTDSTYYEYNNANGFVTLKVAFKVQSNKLIPEMRWEYSYEEKQKDGVKINVNGGYNYKQIYTRTTYDVNGTPKYQDNSENSKRKYYENGTWSEWKQLQY